jgi:hypothetical protein
MHNVNEHQHVAIVYPDIGGRGAVVVNSGLTVANSVPDVIQPTTLARAGRKPDARRPDPAEGGDHGKSWQGCGEGFPAAKKSGAAAPNSASFLDELTINRNRPVGRGKHCGRFSARGRDASAGTTKFHRVNCKCWGCSYCGPRKAKRYRYTIAQTAERLQLRRFITLTLAPATIEGNSVHYLNKTWAKFRTYLKRKFGIAPTFIRVLEFQQNGNPHFHVLIDRYIHWSWLKAAWQAVGGGLFVNIKFVDVHRVSRYLSKYLTKELLLAAPLRSRRVTTSRNIHLNEKPASEIKWEFVRYSIFGLFWWHRKEIAGFQLDAEGILESFSICS